METYRTALPYMVDGTKWEYSEVDRVTGRPKRTQFPVPLHLDPTIESDWTHKYDQWSGDIIVSNGTNADAKDHIYKGPVTPGMFPLDDEAREITAKSAGNVWMPTTDTSIEAQNESYANKLLSGFIDKMTDLKSAVTTAPIDPGITQLLSSMSEMMMKQTEILAQLVGKEKAAVPGVRRQAAV